MLATTHVLVGAGTGMVVPEPFLAFAISIVLHFLTDKISHYWPQTQKSKTGLTIFDWIIAISIVLLLIIFPTPNKYSVVAGVFGGLSVDIIFVGIPFFRKSKSGLWHTKRQPHKKELFMIVTDLLFIIPLAIYFMFTVFDV
jgi:hypothetical protein